MMSSDWWTKEASNDQDAALRSLLARNWGAFPPAWVLEVDVGEARPAFRRFSELGFLERGSAREQFGALLKVALEGAAAADAWCRDKPGTLWSALQVEELPEFERGEMPMPLVSLLMLLEPPRSGWLEPAGDDDELRTLRRIVDGKALPFAVEYYRAGHEKLLLRPVRV
jgi:hypothetical protein